MRLVDQGYVQKDDKAYTHIDPYLQKMVGYRLQDYFGEKINEATVLDLIRMSAGIRDFEDSYSFDQKVLSDGWSFWENFPYDAMEFSVSYDNMDAGGYSG